MAIVGGRLDVLIFHSNSSHRFLDSYGLTSLIRLASARVSNNDRALAGTGLGLLVLNEACSQVTCASATVSKLATNGTVSGTVSVPHAFSLLTGPQGAVVTFSAGHMSLVRLGA